MKQKTWIIIISIICFFIGLILLICSYYQKQLYPESLIPYLMLNIGGILFIGSVYKFINELFLKENFKREIQSSISEKLEKLELDQSIKNSGLYSVTEIFTKEGLIEKLSKSKEVLMLAVRNDGLFSYYSEDIKDLIVNQDLKLNVFFADYTNEPVMDILKQKFGDYNGKELSNSIKKVVWKIKDSIYLKLPEDKKGNLNLRLQKNFPLYSAYLFDEKELWLIPYVYRKSKRPLPIYKFKGEQLIQKNEYCKDLADLMETSEIINIQEFVYEV